jgi:multicomponent K+:H+ antiporter subunit F
MLEIVIPIALGALSLALLLSFYRLLAGPDLPDRILALDSLYTISIALLIVFGIHFDSALYFEIALLIAILGFAGTVAFAKYLLHGDIIQ